MGNLKGMTSSAETPARGRYGKNDSEGTKKPRNRESRGCAANRWTFNRGRCERGKEFTVVFVGFEELDGNGRGVTITGYYCCSSTFWELGWAGDFDGDAALLDICSGTLEPPDNSIHRISFSISP